MPGDERIRANIDGLMAAVNAKDWAALAEWIDPEVEYTPVEEGVCHRGSPNSRTETRPGRSISRAAPGSREAAARLDQSRA
jgi:hypothetical protein